MNHGIKAGYTSTNHFYLKTKQKPTTIFTRYQYTIVRNEEYNRS